MQKKARVLFVGTFPPRACGIGTFTRDLMENLSRSAPSIKASVAAIDFCEDDQLEYGELVDLTVLNSQLGAYDDLAEAVNQSDYDAVCVQHEYGIFPGDWGLDLLNFYRRCRKPVVTILHTVIPKCKGLPREIVREMVHHSDASVVMAKAGKNLLCSDFNLHESEIHVIPHGVPAFHRICPVTAKAKLGLAGRKMVLSFGFLSSGKGIEYMVEAMADVVRQQPDAMYCVLGQTHPIVRKNEGEAYREKLVRLVEEHDLRDNVKFVGKFLSDEELAVYLQAADLFVTPYIGPDQITSGAMARAVFFGKAIVSTPFLYAQELLANGRGRLVPFKDSTALGAQVSELLGHDALRHSLEAKTYHFGRRMSWHSVALEYEQVFREVIEAREAPKETDDEPFPVRILPPYAIQQPAQ